MKRPHTGNLPKHSHIDERFVRINPNGFLFIRNGDFVCPFYGVGNNIVLCVIGSGFSPDNEEISIYDGNDTDGDHGALCKEPVVFAELIHKGA